MSPWDNMVYIMKILIIAPFPGVELKSRTVYPSMSQQTPGLYRKAHFETSTLEEKELWRTGQQWRRGRRSRWKQDLAWGGLSVWGLPGQPLSAQHQQAVLSPRELRTFLPGVNQAMWCCTVTQPVHWALKAVSNLSQFRKSQSTEVPESDSLG